VRDEGARNRHHWGSWAPGEAKPPWWPRNEPFPPTNWPRMRARFMTRMFVFALTALTFFSVFVWLVVSVVTGIFNTLTGGAPNAFVIVGAVLLALFIFFGARGAGRIARPIGDLIEAAEHVERGDYTTRLRARGPREVKKLANAFNAMSARLQGSENERRRLLADVTHELRTPLTVIQGNIEALIDGVHPADETHLSAILGETHVISRLIDDLRTLSTAEAGALALHREMTDIGALARAAVAAFDAQAHGAGVTTHVDVYGAPTADVDPVRIREVLTNVAANALRYTPSGGSVTADVRAGDQFVEIRIRDSGAGIAPEALPHIFERFTHASDSPGAGLGLAIAKSIVTAHGGEITATSTLGQGTEIRFTLPRAIET
jgi:signal transduction histidine kinase